MIGGRLSVLERSVKIYGGGEARGGPVERLVEGRGLDEGVDVGERNVKEFGDRRKRLGVGGEKEAMHGGEFLFHARERAGNGVQLDLKHLARLAVDHVVRAD